MSNKKQYDTDAQALGDLRKKIREIEWNADIAIEAIRIAERYRTKADNQRIMLNQLQRGRLQGSDLISRADAIEAVANYLWHYPNDRYKDLNVFEVGEEIVKEALSTLPSADRPIKHTLPDGTEIRIDEESYEIGYTHGQMDDRPTGEWEGYKADNPDWLRKDGTPVFLICDKCHDMVLNNASAKWNYCPNCGAKMMGGTNHD